MLRAVASYQQLLTELGKKFNLLPSSGVGPFLLSDLGHLYHKPCCRAPRDSVP